MDLKAIDIFICSCRRVDFSYKLMNLSFTNGSYKIVDHHNIVYLSFLEGSLSKHTNPLATGHVCINAWLHVLYLCGIVKIFLEVSGVGYRVGDLASYMV